MSLWGKTLMRDILDSERMEDMTCPGIHNNKSLGNREVFSDAQLALFSDILRTAEEIFHVSLPESQQYNLKKKLEEIPVYLIPYEIYVVEMENSCKSAFASKMSELYGKELERIPDNCSPEEREKILARLRIKYGPWLISCNGICNGCLFVEETPLGYFVPDEDGGKIYICLDKIIEKYPDKVDSIASKVLLHELGHAIMFNKEHMCYETCFEYWAEESLANKIALKYLAIASAMLKRQDLYNDAYAMVSRQKSAYRFGLYLHEHNASDWASLRDAKPHLYKTIADLWVNAACDLLLNPRSISTAELQRLFYRALEKTIMTVSTTSFESWLATSSSGVKKQNTVMNYCAFVTSPYVGLIFKEMVGWSYDTIADCRSSCEIQSLADRIGKKGSSTVEKEFNLATFGCALSSLNKYLQYLLSLGL